MLLHVGGGAGTAAAATTGAFVTIEPISAADASFTLATKTPGAINAAAIINLFIFCPPIPLPRDSQSFESTPTERYIQKAKTIRAVFKQLQRKSKQCHAVSPHSGCEKAILRPGVINWQQACRSFTVRDGFADAQPQLTPSGFLAGAFARHHMNLDAPIHPPSQTCC
jgi:hypothetical protein